LLKASFPDVSFEVKLSFGIVLLVDVVPDDIRCDIANREEEFTPEPWAPDKMVRVLTDCMIKDFQFPFQNLRDSGTHATIGV
jgi:hypothetical protein